MNRRSTGEVTRKENRIILWILGPIIVLFIVVTAVRQDHWVLGKFILIAGLDALGVLPLLAVYKPERFHWAGRAATALIFLGYVAYLVDEIASGGTWRPGPRSEPTPLNALLGLLVIGVPCIRYTLWGRFGLKTEAVEVGTLAHAWLTGQCTRCHKPMAEHDWAGFASTEVNGSEKERLKDLLQSVKNHDWHSVATFQDYDASKDDMLVFVVSCVSGGFVFVVRSPFELGQDDEVYVREAVTQTEMTEIESYITPDSWHVGKSDRRSNA